MLLIISESLAREVAIIINANGALIYDQACGEEIGHLLK